MSKIKLDYSNVLNFITKEEIKSCETSVNTMLEKLITKTGAGNDYIGWLNYPMEIQEKDLDDIINTAKTIRKQGSCLVVIGIGGSYLGAKAAIEMFNDYFEENDFKLIFLGNNMSSEYIRNCLKYLKNIDFSVNVISKSGKTLEPALAFRFVKDLLIEKYGENYYKRIFVTTSNSNSILHNLAVKEGFHEFYIPNSIGGRYSVLTAVGLLPIACAGYDIYEIVKGAINSCQDFLNLPYSENPCFQYAALRNLLYKKGKTTEIFVTYEPKLHYLGEWWKQLYGESEGKDQKGIFPVSLTYSTDLHSVGQYVQDGLRDLFETVINVTNETEKLVVNKEIDNQDGLNYLAGKTIKFVKDQAMTGTIEAHVSGGVPNIVISIDDTSEFTFGYLVYFYMLSCGVSGYLLGVNPFNQEGVEAYKRNMYALLKK